MATATGTLGTFLDRLVDFAEPAADDLCLDVSYGPGPMAGELRGRVHHVTTLGIGPERNGDMIADARRMPFKDHSFSLVTARFSLHRLPSPALALAEMLRVCRPDGRVIIADLARTNCAGDHRDALERVRDPSYRATPSIGQLTTLIQNAGARVSRLDLLTVERPAEPWLAGARDDRTAARLRNVLLAEVDGGPKTGARPRIIGGELWFSQTWAHIAAKPKAAQRFLCCASATGDSGMTARPVARCGSVGGVMCAGVVGGVRAGVVPPFV